MPVPLLEIFTAHRALRGNLALVEHHFCPAVEAKADFASWTVPVSAVDGLSTSVTRLSQARIRHNSNL